MENSKANKQTDANMTLLEMEDTLGKANAMASFIASTLLMASSCPSEIDEDWFGELSLYASDAADVLESVTDVLEAFVISLPAERAARILGYDADDIRGILVDAATRDAEIMGLR